MYHKRISNICLNLDITIDYIKGVSRLNLHKITTFSYGQMK
jgi:hypothetical protein